MPDATRLIEIDLDAAVLLDLPRNGDVLQPAAFETPDGRSGWITQIPGGRPIATPAYADGLLFVGGGYGSYDFHAFDAATGEKVWHMRTADDGPTAAVVEDGLVAFNTESCSVIVCEAKTGRIVWQEWLGDPLMSQPAIYEGRLFMAYPNSRGGNEHRLLCADLRTGQHIWEQVISGDVITAPVITDNKVYFTCFDGRSFCLNTLNGQVVWQKKDNATSAPIVAEGTVFQTEKQVKGGHVSEGLRRKGALRGVPHHQDLDVEEAAEYLTAGKHGGVGIKEEILYGLDASVGFGSAPPAAKLHAAAKHVGASTVAGAWAYQGSRAAYAKKRVLNAQGHTLNSITASDGVPVWRANLKGRKVGLGDQVFSPPALGQECMYLGSVEGHLLSVRQDDGELKFLYGTGLPMVFQPCLAMGNIYVGTTHGALLCLKTDDPDVEGWHMWGGNAQHNKCR
jgi:outer membrane protein assembly factor BamB